MAAPDETTPEPVAAKSKTRTTFLTLPRELRHRIILGSFIAPLISSPLLRGYYRKLQKDTKAWATVLREVNPQLMDDVDYIARRVEGMIMENTFQKLEIGDQLYEAMEKRGHIHELANGMIEIC